MKRRKLPIIVTSLASVLLLGSCAEYLPEPEVPKFEVKEHYMVSFYVDNALYKTARVEAGATVNVEIEAPEKDGFTFEGWQTSDGTSFDLATGVVNSNLSLYAQFKAVGTGTPTENPWDDLNVLGEKDPTKEYSLVIAWYGKTSTSGIDENVMKHFYYNVRAYLTEKGVAQSDLDNISVRMFDDDGQADVAAKIVEQGDVDLAFGAGNKLGTSLEELGKPVLEQEKGFTINGVSGRYHFRLSDKPIAVDLFNYVCTEEGMKMWEMTYLYGQTSEEPTKNPWDDLNVTETKDSTKQYSLVIGWWKRYISVDTMKHFYYNIRNYLIDQKVEESILNGITVRMYDIQGIDDLVPLVNGDGDVDIFFGAGGNFDDKFGTDKVTIAPTGGYSIGEETKRYNAIFDQNNATAKLIYDFMNTEDGIKLWDMNTLYEGKTEEPSEPNVSADNVAEVNLNVLDTKVENKKYHLVIVWYGKTKTSGIDETLMKHFYHNVRAYLIEKGITQTQLDNISVRMFDDSKTDDFAKNILAQGDVDLVFGGGKAIINSFKDAGQELLETTDGTDIFGESGFTIGGKASRYHGRLTDDAVAKDLFDYVSTKEGMKMWDATYEYGK